MVQGGRDRPDRRNQGHPEPPSPVLEMFRKQLEEGMAVITPALLLRGHSRRRNIEASANGAVKPNSINAHTKSR